MMENVINKVRKLVEELGFVGIFSVLFITGICVLIGVVLYKEDRKSVV